MSREQTEGRGDGRRSIKQELAEWMLDNKCIGIKTQTRACNYGEGRILSVTFLGTGLGDYVVADWYATLNENHNYCAPGDSPVIQEFCLSGHVFRVFDMLHEYITQNRKASKTNALESRRAELIEELCKVEKQIKDGVG